MPRVPIYDSPQVAPSGQSFGRFADSPGGIDPGAQQKQLGETLMQAGGAAARVATDMGNDILRENEAIAREQAKRMAEWTKQADETRVMEGENVLRSRELAWTYSPEEGYTKIQGAAALKRPSGKPLDVEYSERYDKAVSDISKDLGSDAQRAEFAKRANSLRNSFMTGLTKHVGKEFTDYQLSVTGGAVKLEQEAVVLAWADPARVGQGIGTIRAAVAKQGELQGWSAMQTEAAIVAAESPAHYRVTAAAVDAGQAGYAEQYLKTYGERMTADDRMRAKGLVEAGAFEAKAQGYTEQFLKESKGDPVAALAMARGKLTGKEEDAVVTRIKAIDAEQVALRERAQKTAADAAWQYVANGKAPPPSLLQQMDGRDVRAIRKEMERGGKEDSVKTDSNTYYMLSIAASEDSEKFKNEDLRRYYDRLSPQDRKHFIDAQAKLRKPDDAARVVAVGSQISAAMRGLNLGTDEQKGAFQQEVDRALDLARKDKGKALSQEESRDVIDKLTLSGKAPGQWIGTTKAWEAQASGKAFTPVWSDDQKRKAANDLAAVGVKDPTKEQTDEYLRKKYDFKPLETDATRAIAKRTVSGTVPTEDEAKMIENAKRALQRNGIKNPTNKQAVEALNAYFGAKK